MDSIKALVSSSAIALPVRTVELRKGPMYERYSNGNMAKDQFLRQYNGLTDIQPHVPNAFDGALRESLAALKERVGGSCAKANKIADIGMASGCIVAKKDAIAWSSAASSETLNHGNGELSWVTHAPAGGPERFDFYLHRIHAEISAQVNACLHGMAFPNLPGQVEKMLQRAFVFDWYTDVRRVLGGEDAPLTTVQHCNVAAFLTFRDNAYLVRCGTSMTFLFKPSRTLRFCGDGTNAIRSGAGNDGENLVQSPPHVKRLSQTTLEGWAGAVMLMTSPRLLELVSQRDLEVFFATIAPGTDARKIAAAFRDFLAPMVTDGELAFTLVRF